MPSSHSILSMSEGHRLPPGRGTPGEGKAGKPAPEPSHAERARTIVAATNRGVLSTVALDPAGYPFGSVATYALDQRGWPVLFVSALAEHTRNAAADPRASLLVAEAAPEGSDPLAAGRVSLVGDLLPVEGQERDRVRDAYLAANPASASYIDFGDFGFWRLEVGAVRYVGGYGRMSWVEARDYAAARPDPLAGEPAGSVIAHMNADHAGALALLARTLGGNPAVTGATMTAVDRYGFDLVVETPAGQGALRIGFPAPVSEPDAVRPVMVELVRRARAAPARRT